ncbi:dehydrogenase [Streptomyces sp. NPDC127072]|uniref:dehydrogenase n=1 Tax=Streptomyces sp. NPDC127072 TaxID=3347129 RepID=UPI00364D41A6
MTNNAPAYPKCSHPMESGGLVLSAREDDGQRACRAVWRCADRHVWWNWADRPDEPLEVCPTSGLFR